MIMKSDVYHMGDYSSVGPKCTKSVKFLKMYSRKLLRWYTADCFLPSQTMNDYRVHCGVDLQVSLGDEVKAVADGVIGNIYADPFEGTCIRLVHKDGYVSVYKNLCPELISGLKEGDSVVGGQTIATVGESAIVEICDETHLHLEVYLNGSAIDPMSVLPYDANEVIYSE